MKDLRMAIVTGGLIIGTLLIGKGVYELNKMDKKNPNLLFAYYFAGATLESLSTLILLHKYEKYRVKKLEEEERN